MRQADTAPFHEEVFKNAVRTGRLVLAGKKIRAFSQRYCTLSFALTTLDLHDNCLIELPDEIVLLRGLVHLELQHNRLRQLPECVGSLHALRVLRANHNNLASLATSLAALRHLEVFHVHCNNIPTIAAEFFVFKYIASLDWSDNPLDEPLLSLLSREGTRATLPYLEALSEAEKNGSAIFRGMNIPVIPDAVGSLNNLRVLDLRNCTNLVYVSNALRLCENTLEIVQLGGCEALVSPPPEVASQGAQAVLRFMKQIADASQTGCLSIPRAGLRSFPAELSRDIGAPWPIIRLLAISELVLCGNAIRMIPDTIAQLHSLCRLDLSHNSIGSVSIGVLSKCQSLQMLDLSHNTLQALPSDIGSMPSLVALDVRECQLSDLPESLARCSSLGSLRLDGNLLREFPLVTTTLSNLHEFSIAGNPLTWPDAGLLDKLGSGILAYVQAVAPVREYPFAPTLSLGSIRLDCIPEEVCTLRNVTEFSCTNLQLKQLPDAIADLRKLRCLDVSENCLAKLPDTLCSLEHLEDLRAAENRLLALPTNIGRLHALKSLHVQFNRLETLPTSINGCAALLEVNLESNELLWLPLEVAECTRLVSISVAGNHRLVLPPQEVSQRGSVATLHFLKRLALAVESQSLNFDQLGLHELPVAVSRTARWKSSSPQTIENGNDIVGPRTSSVVNQDGTGGEDSCAECRILGTIDDSGTSGSPQVPNGAAHDDLDASDRSAHGATAPDLVPTRQQLQIANPPHSAKNPLEAVTTSVEDSSAEGTRIGSADSLESTVSLYEQRVSQWTRVLRFVDHIFPSIKKISAQNNRITQLPDAIGQHMELVELRVGYNRLSSVPLALCASISLSVLDMSHNHITTVPDEIQYLESLEFLNLASNSISELPAALGNLRRLRHMKVQDNHIAELGDWVAELRSLEFMDIRTNALQRLPLAMGNLHDVLRDLRVAFNDLIFPHQHVLMQGTAVVLAFLAALARGSASGNVLLQHFTLIELPRDLLEMKRMVELDVSHNALRALPDALATLQHLRVLDVSHNQLSCIPESIAALHELQVLRARHNRIDHLPGALGDNSQLCILDIIGNPIRYIPASLWKLHWLEQLVVDPSSIDDPPPHIIGAGPAAVRRYLERIDRAMETRKLLCSETNLREFPPSLLERAQRIHVLDVRDNQLESIGTVCEYLVEMRVLIASGNRLTEVPDSIASASRLRILDLSCNQIRTIANEIDELKALVYANFSSNQLALLPPSFGGLRSLERLDVRSNLFRTVPLPLCDLLSLRELDMRGNEIRALPLAFSRLSSLEVLRSDKLDEPTPEIVLQGTEAVLKYYTALQRAVATRSLELASFGLRSLPVEAARTRPAVLDLSHNALDEHCLRLSSVSELQSLILCECALAKLPSDIVSIYTLRVLDVSGCGLVELPAELGALGALDTLRATRNALSTLPSSIGSLSRLHTIDVSINNIRALPTTFGGLPTLEHAKFVRNRLTNADLQTIARIKTLREAALTANAYTELPPQLGLLKHLTDVSFDTHDLQVPPPFIVTEGIERTLAYLARLHAALEARSLDLSGFAMESIPHHITRIPSLHCLIVATNRITTLPRAQLVSLRSLRELTLDYNLLEEFPESLVVLQGLTVLRANRNALRSIPDFLNELVHLEVLELQGNLVPSIPPCIASLVALRLLDLRDNRIHDLPPALGRLLSHNLADVRIDRNPLGSLPSAITSKGAAHVLAFIRSVADCLESQKLSLRGAQLERFFDPGAALASVTIVDLSRNLLTSIPIQLKAATNLRRLDISHNRIRDIHDLDIEALAPSLQVLNLSSNAVRSLSSSLGRLTALRDLRLDDNEIAILPPEVGLLVNLETLTVSKNLITELPDVFHNLENLRLLHAADNDLRALPESLSACEELHTFRIEGNSIHTLPPWIGRLRNLSRLVARDNMIEELPEALDDLVSLYELDLSNNPIVRAPAKPRVFAVAKIVRIDYTAVEHIAALHAEVGTKDALPSLPIEILANGRDATRTYVLRMIKGRSSGTLDLSDTYLRALPPEVAEMRNIRKLKLDNTRLVELPIQLGLLPNLTHISVRNTPLLFPPRKVVAQGSDAIPAFLQGIARAITDNRIVLDGWGLEQVPNAILSLPNVEVLSLADNAISHLSPRIHELSRLRVLNLRRNRLVSLSAELARCSLLQELDLAENNLTALPAELCALSDLRVLNVEGNPKLLLPPVEMTRGKGAVPRCLAFLAAVQKSKQGRAIVLPGLRMRALDDIPGVSLELVAGIDLARNKFSDVPALVGKCSNLTELRLQRNMMSHVDTACFRHAHHLRVLDLSRNRIRTVDGLPGSLKELQELDLSHNELESLPDPLWLLPRLEHLNVSHNRLLRLTQKHRRDELLARQTAQSQIRYLSLGYNRLPASEVSSVCSLCPRCTELFAEANALSEWPDGLARLGKGLRKIDFSRNFLDCVPDNAKDMLTLHVLLLSRNRIRSVAPGLSSCSQLEVLDLSDNPLAYLPLPILQLPSLRELFLHSTPSKLVDSLPAELKTRPGITVTLPASDRAMEPSAVLDKHADESGGTASSGAASATNDAETVPKRQLRGSLIFLP